MSADIDVHWDNAIEAEASQRTYEWSAKEKAMVEDAWRTGDPNPLLDYRDRIQAAAGATGGRSSPRSNVNAARLAALSAEVQELMNKPVCKHDLQAPEMVASRWALLQLSFAEGICLLGSSWTAPKLVCY
jgi:hypothetical protein